MTTLEKGKFIKNFCRTSDGKKIPHSNWKGYSVKDIEEIEPKIDSIYWSAWEKYLHDKKNDEKLQSQYSDYKHFLFQLNDIDDKDIKKYGLPEDYIIL
jgi:hypothetical protein